MCFKKINQQLENKRYSLLFIVIFLRFPNSEGLLGKFIQYFGFFFCL